MMIYDMASWLAFSIARRTWLRCIAKIQVLAFVSILHVCRQYFAFYIVHLPKHLILNLETVQDFIP